MLPNTQYNDNDQDDQEITSLHNYVDAATSNLSQAWWGHQVSALRPCKSKVVYRHISSDKECPPNLWCSCTTSHNFSYNDNNMDWKTKYNIHCNIRQFSCLQNTYPPLELPLPSRSPPWLALPCLNDQWEGKILEANDLLRELLMNIEGQ